MAITKELEAYATSVASQLDPFLSKVLDFTLKEHKYGGMASGHEQGVFLTMLSRIRNPKRILEVGTFTGFSAICLASGMAQDGVLHTIEINEADAQIASGFFKEYERGNQIQLHVGDAKEIISSLHEKWDLVFIDAEKTSYEVYYDLIIPNLSAEGIIIADNMFLHGRVIESPLPTPSAEGIAKFTDRVKNDLHTVQIIVPLRDGLMLIMNKPNADKI